MIAAMKKAFAQTVNGTNGSEAGFSVNGSSMGYTILGTGANSSNIRCNANIAYTSSTFALFHVHPNGCLPQPSPGDKNASNLLDVPFILLVTAGCGSMTPPRKIRSY